VHKAPMKPRISPTRMLERQAEETAARVVRTAGRLPVSDERSGSTGENHRDSLENSQPRHHLFPTRGVDLATGLRGIFEPLFGFDFSGVRVHTDAASAERVRTMDAVAFTVGRDIAFGAGTYDTSSAPGCKLLAHELAHVVQQAKGDIGPEVQRAPIVGGPAPIASPAELEDLKKVLWDLVRELDDKTLRNVYGRHTIAIGLVEDEEGTFLVYTQNSNKTSPAIRAVAERLGITRWEATPRAGGRGVAGAPNYAEQLLIEAAEATAKRLLPSRRGARSRQLRSTFPGHAHRQWQPRRRPQSQRPRPPVRRQPPPSRLKTRESLA
jgi:hypothetical protein